MADLKIVRLGARRDPMAQLGTDTTGAVDVVEAFEMADLDYELVKVPIWLNGIVELADGSELDVVQESEKEAVLKVDAEGEIKELAHVGETYELTAPLKFAKAINPLADAYPVERVASIGGGRMIAVQFEVGEYEINGQYRQQKLTVTDRHDGRGGIGFGYLDYTIVCANTFIMALKDAEKQLGMGHTTGVLKALEWKAQLEVQVEHTKRLAVQQFTAMANFVATTEVVNDAAKLAFPDPRMKRELRILTSAGTPDANGTTLDAEGRAKAEEQRPEYDRRMELAEAGRTAFAQMVKRLADEREHGYSLLTVMDAGTEILDWYGFNNQNDGQSRQALFGDRAANKRNVHAYLLDVMLN